MNVQTVTAFSTKRWDQGRMNVDNSVLVGADELAAQNLQESCQNNQLNTLFRKIFKRSASLVIITASIPFSSARVRA